MARRREVERAKRKLVAETEDRDWLQAVGVGRVDDELGLVLSVRPGAKSAASRLLNRLQLDVPVTVRAIEEIRAREPVAAAAEPDSLDALRDAALARLDKPQS